MVLPLIAAVAGGAIGALGSRSAAKTQANAANRAADAQLTATRETNDMLRDFRQEDVQRFRPFYWTGVNALNDYVGKLGKGFDFNFEADPGYQFRLNQGLDAVESSAAARHGLGSGAAMKALTRYGQDYGSNEYNNVFNRQYGMWNDRMNRLGQLAASGQNAAGMQAAASQNYGGQLAQNTMQGGQAQAQGYANVGNANAAGAVGMANAFTGGINNALGAWQMNNMINAFNTGTPAPATSAPAPTYSMGTPVSTAVSNPYRIGMPMGGR